jgi:hypothetical protein
VKYRYVASRYDVEIEDDYETLTDAMHRGWSDIEFNSAYPLELWHGKTLVYSNRDGHPLTHGTCPFTDAIWDMARHEGWDD